MRCSVCGIIQIENMAADMEALRAENAKLRMFAVSPTASDNFQPYQAQHPAVVEVEPLVSRPQRDRRQPPPPPVSTAHTKDGNSLHFPAAVESSRSAARPSSSWRTDQSTAAPVPSQPYAAAPTAHVVSPTMHQVSPPLSVQVGRTSAGTAAVREPGYQPAEPGPQSIAGAQPSSNDAVSFLLRQQQLAQERASFTSARAGPPRDEPPVVDADEAAERLRMLAELRQQRQEEREQAARQKQALIAQRAAGEVLHSEPTYNNDVPVGRFRRDESDASSVPQPSRFSRQEPATPTRTDEGGELAKRQAMFADIMSERGSASTVATRFSRMRQPSEDALPATVGYGGTSEAASTGYDDRPVPGPAPVTLTNLAECYSLRCSNKSFR